MLHPHPLLQAFPRPLHLHMHHHHQLQVQQNRGASQAQNQNQIRPVIIPPPQQQPPKPLVAGNPNSLHRVLESVDKKTLVWIGKIDPGVDNDVLKEILGACGKYDSWKRVQDPTGGRWKKFGFCEYLSAEGALRAFRLLGDFQLGPTTLMLKVEQKVADYLQEYQSSRKELSNTLMEEDRLQFEEGPPDLGDARITENEDDPDIQVDEKREFTSSHELFPPTKRQALHDRAAMMKIKQLLKINKHLIPTKETIDEKAVAEKLAEEREAEKARREKEKEERDAQREKEREERHQKEKEKEKEKEREREKEKEKEREKDRERRDRREDEAKRRDDRYKEEKKRDRHDTSQKKDSRKRDKPSRKRDKDSRKRDKDSRKRDKDSRKRNKDSRKRDKKHDREDRKRDRSPEKDRDDESHRKKSSNDDSAHKRDPSPRHRSSKDEESKRYLRPEDNPKLKGVFGKDEDEPVLAKEEPKIQLKLEEVKVQTEKSDPQHLLAQIPTQTDALFAYSVEWDAVDWHLTSRLKAWVTQKISALLGEEETSLVEYIMSLIKGRSTPEKVLGEVQPILDNESELFVVELWQMLILEVLKSKAEASWD